MEELKQKAEKAIEEICKKLNSVEGCEAISSLTRYIGWLEGKVLHLNTKQPINIYSPLKTNLDWEIHNSKKIFEYMPPMFTDDPYKKDKDKLFEVTCLANGREKK